MYKRLYSVRKYLKMTQRQLADVMGIGQNAYSMIENGRISLTPRNRAILEDRLNISIKYLEKGIGPMILSEKKKDNAPSHEIEQNSETVAKLGVPYFPHTIRGVIESLDVFTNEEPEYYINIEPFNDCSFYRPVIGHSMAPRYNTGDIVACKRVQNKRNILFGQTYLCLISYEGDFNEVIRVLRRDDDPDKVVLMPINTSYDPMTIPLSAIVELYLIKGKIERSI